VFVVCIGGVCDGDIGLVFGSWVDGCGVCAFWGAMLDGERRGISCRVGDGFLDFERDPCGCACRLAYEDVGLFEGIVH
jgi:hypothetical protein